MEKVTEKPLVKITKKHIIIEKWLFGSLISLIIIIQFFSIFLFEQNLLDIRYELNGIKAYFKPLARAAEELENATVRRYNGY